MSVSLYDSLSIRTLLTDLAACENKVHESEELFQTLQHKPIKGQNPFG